MTWTWSLPSVPPPGAVVRRSTLRLDQLRVVIPTYRDWDEARATVESILACRPRPLEIVVVDDNGGGMLPGWTRSRALTILRHPANRGPAYARNTGARHDSGRPIGWLYFTDGACTRASSFFGELVESVAHLPVNVVAVGGPVGGVSRSPDLDPLNHYMTVEQILWPPFDRHGPQAIVTANAAVCRSTFELVGGFRTEFRRAAGEDLDLGLRLRRVGGIGWVSGACVRHAFEERLEAFVRRFERYGEGNAQLAVLWNLPSLRAQPFVAGEGRFQELADLQIAALQRGYDRQMREMRRFG